MTILVISYLLFSFSYLYSQQNKQDTDGADSTNSTDEDADNNGKEIKAMIYVMNTQDTVSPHDAVYYRIIDDGYGRINGRKAI